MFICQNCGDCCGPIPVSKDELHDIIEAIRHMSPEERSRLKNQKRDKFTCPLRDIEKKRCSVYGVRPKVCQLFGQVERLRCPHNLGASVMSKVQESMELKGIREPVGVLGMDIGWKEIETKCSQLD